MSMITPSPVRFDEFVEGGFIELSVGAATNCFNHGYQSRDLIQPPSTWIDVPVM